ncbi:MAG: DUF1461 domain-containing protein [Candidatus Woesearchaeota archaeon]|jgi:integral membrane protein (TIGR01906 family)|nr:DUF1461 domain-containing protein [Candidatus Woesearchaeota archaeon]
MKKKNILKWTLILFISSLILLTNFKLVLFNEDFYQQEFTKLNIYNKFENADEINKDLLNYFKNKENLIQNDFFNEKEKSHLADVKRLINISLNLFYLLLISSIVLLVLSLIHNKDRIKSLSNIFILSAILTFTKLLFTYILIRLNFSTIFLSFHYVFFPQGNFLFNPAVDNIVNLYPSQFFLDITQRMITDTLFWAFIVLLIGILLPIIANNKIFIVKKNKKKQ